MPFQSFYLQFFSTHNFVWIKHFWQISYGLLYNSCYAYKHYLGCQNFHRHDNVVLCIISAQKTKVTFLFYCMLCTTACWYTSMVTIIYLINEQCGNNDNNRSLIVNMSLKQEIKDLWHIWSIWSVYLSINFVKSITNNQSDSLAHGLSRTVGESDLCERGREVMWFHSLSCNSDHTSPGWERRERP